MKRMAGLMCLGSPHTGVLWIEYEASIAAVLHRALERRATGQFSYTAAGLAGEPVLTSDSLQSVRDNEIDVAASRLSPPRDSR